MNDFGEFLFKLRKEKGMTQAELAQALGVTNKAVSKWETGEAMPETALLLPISRIFGVSVDELLDGKRSDNAGAGDEHKSIKDHDFAHGKGDSETLHEKICGAVCAAVIFCGVTVYFLLGILGGLWTPYWVIIPVSALFCGVIGILFDVFNAKKRETKLARGENPYTGAICGILMLVCTITYLLLGAFLNLWHPLWIIIVAGAFACGLVATVGEIIKYKRKGGGR